MHITAIKFSEECSTLLCMLLSLPQPILVFRTLKESIFGQSANKVLLQIRVYEKPCKGSSVTQLAASAWPQAKGSSPSPPVHCVRWPILGSARHRCSGHDTSGRPVHVL